MAEKPNGANVVVREQIIEDEVTGLTLKFERALNGEGRLRLYGNLSFGNRDFMFSQDGRLVGMGTAVCERPRPTWLRLGD